MQIQENLSEKIERWILCFFDKVRVNLFAEISVIVFTFFIVNAALFLLCDHLNSFWMKLHIAPKTIALFTIGPYLWFFVAILVLTIKYFFVIPKVTHKGKDE